MWSRRSVRIPGFDYGQPGAYFVTVCTRGREPFLADIVEGRVRLRAAGRIAERCWMEIPTHFPYVALDRYVIMPDHLHGILWFHRRGTPWRAPTPEGFGKPSKGSLPTVIRSFKAATTRLVRVELDESIRLWQRGFYERVIRGEPDLGRVQGYMEENPLAKELDNEEPG